MNHPTKIFLCLGLLGLASAQSSVVSLFIPDTGRQPLVASIMGNDATATTYSITCPPTFHECGMGPGIVYTGGPKTAAWSISEPGFAGGFDCSVGGTTTAVCKSSASGPQANFPGVKTISQSHVPLLPVTVTAGSVTDVTSGTGAPATQGTATGAGTATATTTGQTSGAESTGTASQVGSGSSTAASTGGLPAVTGNAGLAGAVVVAVAAAVL